MSTEGFNDDCIGTSAENRATMSESRRRKVVRGILACGLGGALVAVSAWSIVSNSTSVTADDTTDLLSDEELQEELPSVIENYSELNYPSPATENRASDAVNELVSEQDSHYENGVQDIMVIETWKCSWFEFAVDSHDSGDAAGVIAAGQELMTMTEISKLQETSTALDAHVESVVAPLLDGDVSMAQAEYISGCAGWWF